MHLVRAPIGGRIVTSAYTPGEFLNAELDKSSEENERRAHRHRGPRRREGRDRADRWTDRPADRDFRGRGGSVAQGERIGLIRFGSRVDVYMPKDAKVLRRSGPDGDRRRDGAGGGRIRQ